MRFWVTVATLLFPGYAQGLVHRRLRMALWAGAALAPFALAVWLPWALPGYAIVRIASAIDGYRCYKRDARPGGTNRAAAAMAVVITAVGIGVVRLSVVSYRIPSSSDYPTLLIGDHVLVNKLSTKLRGVTRGELIAFVDPCEPELDVISRVVAVAGDSVAVACDVLYVNGAAVPRVRVGDEDYVDYYDGEASPRRSTRYHETLGDIEHDMYIDDHGPDVLRTFPTSPPHCERPSVAQVAGQIIDPPSPLTTDCQPHKLYVVPPGHVFVMDDNRTNANDSRVWGSVPIENVIGRLASVWMPFGRIRRVD